MEENISLKCQICDLHTMKLYPMIIRKDGKDRHIEVCRLCRQDIKKNHKFTRPKVKHDYESAMKYIKELHKKKNT